jgi:DNA-binding NarL/FixJ family response regulator
MKAQKRTVVIADDHPLFREGLKAMVTSSGRLEVVAEAGDGTEAIHCVRQHRPDLLILDLSMPRLSGIGAISELKACCPEVKILALTIHEADQYVLEVFEAGAEGYCVKDAGRDEIMAAIETVIDGKTFVSPAIAHHVVACVLGKRKHPDIKSLWHSFTPRERDILKMLAEGYAETDIAELLGLGVETVAQHCVCILNKLELENPSLLAPLVIAQGFTGEQK